MNEDRLKRCEKTIVSSRYFRDDSTAKQPIPLGKVLHAPLFVQLFY